MESIKHNKIQSRKFICDYCGTELNVPASALRFAEIKSMLRETYYFYCPICSHKISKTIDGDFIFYEEK